MAEGVEDGAQAPAVTISSPANGAVLTSDTATVVGTASDNIGVHSLSVNGIPTPVGDDDAWSVEVPLAPGANTITAIATDESGNTGQAQTAVTYSPPGAPSCTVPNVVNQTQAAASAALTGAGCSVGALSLAPSRTIAKGNVVSQGNPAGQRVSAFYPVPLVISSGQIGQASLVRKSLRLKGRRISMQVHCPASAGDACNGTIKLRTNRLRGAKRTLGTRSFQAPPGARRSVTLQVSKRNARLIHRAGRVRGLAFIVYRDEDGNARTSRTRITIRG